MSLYEKRLQQDLNQIRHAMIAMGDGVETALKNALQSLFTGNEVLANMTILLDDPLDRKCQMVDRLCHAFIAKHLPSAGHLRLISSSMRMIYDLERIADYAVNICRESLDLSSPPSGVRKQALESMATSAKTMLRQALTAFAEENVGLARSTIEMNGQMSKVLDSAFRDLVQQGNGSTGQSRAVMDLYVIFYMLERVGGRATNLCEEIIFWLTGESPAAKVVNILFLDEENNAFGLMAEAIAKKNYGSRCRFFSMGRLPAKTPHPQMVAFMQASGFDLSEAKPKGLDGWDINSINIIIGLQGPVRSYIPKPPFQTVYLNWDVGALSDTSDASVAHLRFDEIYRELAVQLRQLMDIVMG